MTGRLEGRNARGRKGEITPVYSDSIQNPENQLIVDGFGKARRTGFLELDEARLCRGGLC